MNENVKNDALVEYDRHMYRSALVSLFWSVIQARKSRKSGFQLKELADKLKVDKSAVSRWFSTIPNWEANTVSDIANALDVELRIVAYDRTDGNLYAASGKQAPVRTTGSTAGVMMSSNMPKSATRSDASAELMAA